MGNSPQRSAVLFAAFALSVSTPSAATTVSYRAIDLGVFPGDAGSRAVTLNNREEVVGVGWRTDSVLQREVLRAVMWRAGAAIDLGTLPAPYDYEASASDINLAGSVVGTSNGENGSSHAFLWRDGVMTDLGTLGGPSSGAIAINDRHQVVGWAQTATSYNYKGVRYVAHAFLWQDGTMIDLGTLGCSGSCPMQEYSTATDINDRGEIVGASSTSNGLMSAHFLWQAGAMRALTGLASGDNVEIAGINSRGDVIGTDESQSWTPIIWRRGGAASSLAGACSGLGEALALNDFGAVLSYGQSPTTGHLAPTVCYRRTLNYLPPVDVSWGDLAPMGMNDRGAVVGQGSLPAPDGTGLEHAVLWTPRRELSCD